ncbi:MAG: sarcosine oxidase subunit delta [Actinomycetota bacterium]
MSLRIVCPFCGERPLSEWVHGEILDVPAEIVDADARDVDRGYFHNNTEGEVGEVWFHLYGCRRWVRVVRDTQHDAVR